jgi:hypothetical protein
MMKNANFQQINKAGASLEDLGNSQLYKDAHEESIRDPEGYWARVSENITWMKPWQRVLDHSNPPFTKW